MPPRVETAPLDFDAFLKTREPGVGAKPSPAPAPTPPATPSSPGARPRPRRETDVAPLDFDAFLKSAPPPAAIATPKPQAGFFSSLWDSTKHFFGAETPPPSGTPPGVQPGAPRPPRSRDTDPEYTKRVLQWSPLIERLSAEEGVDSRIIHAMVDQESGYDPAAKSKAGAFGLMQLMPDTSGMLGVDPAVPEENLRGGIRYFKDLLAQWKTVPLALAAYNAGPGRVRDAGGQIPNIRETQNYVAAITRRLGEAPPAPAAPGRPAPEAPLTLTPDVQGVLPQVQGAFVPLPPQPPDAFVVDAQTPPRARQAITQVRAQRGRLTEEAGREAQTLAGIPEPPMPPVPMGLSVTRQEQVTPPAPTARSTPEQDAAYRTWAQQRGQGSAPSAPSAALVAPPPLTGQQLGVLPGAVSGAPGRPIMEWEQPDGSRGFSTHFNIRAQVDGRTYILPTMYGGKIVSPDEAVAIARQNKMVDRETGQPLPSFATDAEAAAAEAKLHDTLAQQAIGVLKQTAWRPRGPTPTAPQELQPRGAEAVAHANRFPDPLARGLYQGAAGFWHVLDNTLGLIDKASDILARQTGIDKGSAFSLMQEYARNLAKWGEQRAARIETREDLLGALGEAIGQAPAAVAEYTVGGKVLRSTAAGMALIDALRTADKGWVESGIAAAKGAMTGTLLHMLSPLERLTRSLLAGGIFGGERYLETGDTREALVSGLTMGALSALGPDGPVRLRNMFRRVPPLEEMEREGPPVDEPEPPTPTPPPGPEPPPNDPGRTAWEETQQRFRQEQEARDRTRQRNQRRRQAYDEHREAREGLSRDDKRQWHDWLRAIHPDRFMQGITDQEFQIRNAYANLLNEAFQRGDMAAMRQVWDNFQRDAATFPQRPGQQAPPGTQPPPGAPPPPRQDTPPPPRPDMPPGAGQAPPGQEPPPPGVRSPDPAVKRAPDSDAPRKAPWAMSYSEFVASLAEGRLAPFGHESDAAEAVIAGRKPVATVSFVTRNDAVYTADKLAALQQSYLADGLGMAPLLSFEEWQQHRRQEEAHGYVSTLDFPYVIARTPGEASAAVARIRALSPPSLPIDSPRDFEYDLQMGRLLGYSDADIAFFYANSLARAAGARTPAEQYAWIQQQTLGRQATTPPPGPQAPPGTSPPSPGGAPPRAEAATPPVTPSPDAIPPVATPSPVAQTPLPVPSSTTPPGSADELGDAIEATLRDLGVWQPAPTPAAPSPVASPPAPVTPPPASPVSGEPPLTPPPEPSVTPPGSTPPGVPATAQPHRYSTTQLTLPTEDAARVTALHDLIARDDIDPTEGLEREPHITLKYGLETDDPALVATHLRDQGPLSVTVGDIDVFEGKDADAVILRVDSPALHQLHQTLKAEVPNTETYPTYQPHITLGYVQKGAGAKYKGLQHPLQGQTLTFSGVDFRDRQGVNTPLPLGEGQAATPPESETFTRGDAVEFEGRDGVQLSGRIRSGPDWNVGGYLVYHVDVDQIRTIGGRIPIGRIESIRVDRLRRPGTAGPTPPSELPVTPPTSPASQSPDEIDAALVAAREFLRQTRGRVFTAEEMATAQQHFTTLEHLDYKMMSQAGRTSRARFREELARRLVQAEKVPPSTPPVDAAQSFAASSDAEIEDILNAATEQPPPTTSPPTTSPPTTSPPSATGIPEGAQIPLLRPTAANARALIAQVRQTVTSARRHQRWQTQDPDVLVPHFELLRERLRQYAQEMADLPAGLAKELRMAGGWLLQAQVQAEATRGREPDVSQLLKDIRGLLGRGQIPAARVPLAQDLIAAAHVVEAQIQRVGFGEDEAERKKLQQVRNLRENLETSLPDRYAPAHVRTPEWSGRPSVPLTPPPAPAATPPATPPVRGPQIARASRKGGGEWLDVIFPDKPSVAVRDQLKAAGFKWHGPIKGWRAPFTEGRDALVQQLLAPSVVSRAAGGTAPAAAPAPQARVEGTGLTAAALDAMRAILETPTQAEEEGAPYGDWRPGVDPQKYQQLEPFFREGMQNVVAEGKTHVDFITNVARVLGKPVLPYLLQFRDVLRKETERGSDQPRREPGEPPERPDGTDAGRTEPAGEPGGGDQEPLADVSPPPIRGSGAPGSAESDRDAGGRASAPETPEPAAPGDAVRSGVGGGARPGVSPGRGGRPGTRRGSGTTRGAGKPGVDYRITTPEELYPLGAKDRYRRNVEAVTLLKALEAAGKLATPEQQAILAKFSGWGAISQVFDEQNEREWFRPDWKREYQELKALLTDAEYRAARASTTNAFYTDARIITAIYDALTRLGFQHGRILEPSLGVGNFFGVMPPKMREPSTLTGIELDSLSARLAQQLYQSADVRQSGFEDALLADNFFDVAVSNVPFGDYTVNDPKYNRYRFPIHTYFFAKALDKMRPGGVLAFITSRFTFDRADSSQREFLAKQGRLLGAIRLPQGAFQKVAGTEVDTDILFLQKPYPGMPAGEGFTGTTILPGTDIPVNEYYVRHPEMMLGEMRRASTMYNPRGEPALIARPGDDLEALLDAAITKLPRKVMPARDAQHKPPEDKLFDAFDAGDEALPNNAYTVRDGKVYQRDGAKFVARDLPAATAERIRGMVAIRNAARALLAAQYQGADEAAVQAAMAELNRVYDAFTRVHGAISGPQVGNIRAFRADPDMPLLLSLEHYNPETKTATKAAIFTQRTVRRVERPTHVDTPDDALLTSLAYEGRIDWDTMSRLSGQSPEQLRAALAGKVFENPNGGGWETADQYLSGDVRQKLADAQGAAQSDPRFQVNVSALETVQPPPVPIHDVDIRLGANWVPEETYLQFFREIFESPTGVTITYNAPMAQWDVTAGHTVGNDTTWGVEYLSGADLATGVMNFRQLQITYRDPATNQRVVDAQATLAVREKMERMRRTFQEWVLQHPDVATQLKGEYNRTMNRYVEQQHDGSHLTLPGLSPVITPRPHQLNAVWRGIQDGSALFAHAVGAGKTLALAATAMELRRLGLAAKPLFVVPNHLINQWPGEILRYYPGARVLGATTFDLQADRRQQFFGRIATGDWDAVVLPFSSFTFLPVSDGFFNSLIQEQLDILNDFLREYAPSKGRRDPRVKQLEAAKKRLEAQLRVRRDTDKQSKLLTFEELGVDALFIDEFHNYKNLYFSTKMTQVTGLGSGDAKRAFDLYTKVRYLQQLNNGRGIFGGTGTPISNTLAEAYTVMRYFQPDLMEDLGVQHFDAWVASFADTVTRVEVTPTGSGFAPRTSFSRFRNMPELRKLMMQRMDIQTASMLKLPIPALAGGQAEAVTVPPSPELQAFVQTLVGRASHLPRDRREDNMLKITHEGRMAALDIRLMVPGAPEPAQTKVKEAVTRIVAFWRETADRKATQLVFLDMGMPRGTSTKAEKDEQTSADEHEDALHEAEGTADDQRLRTSIYEDLRTKLRAAGVPADEIAFIHDANTDAKRILLFQKVRRGDVRVLIGSTAKMGEGMNVQDRLIALHHLDSPWKPSEIEQREGRILRQGNMHIALNIPVHVYRYITQGSFDAYMWQTLERKQRAFGAFLDGSGGARSMEDLGDARLNSYAEATAAASGNPLVLEKHQIEMQMASMEAARSEAMRARFSSQRELAGIPMNRRALESTLAEQEQHLARYNEAKASGTFHMTLGKYPYTDPKEAGQKLLDAAARMAALSYETAATPLGTYLGVEVYGFNNGPLRDASGTEHFYPSVLGLQLPGWRHTIDITAANPDPVETVNRLNRIFERIGTQEIPDTQQRLTDLTTREQALSAEVDKPLPYTDELAALEARRAEILRATEPAKPQTPTADELLGDEGEEAEAEEEGAAYASTPDAAEPQPPYAPPFYSAVRRAVETRMPTRAAAADVKALLQKTPGVKQDELQWLGVFPWLDAQGGPVTKQQVLDFLERQQVEVVPLVLGEPRPQGDRGGPRTRYDSYTLPGAEPGSYREVLFTLPVPNAGQWEVFDPRTGQVVHVVRTEAAAERLLQQPGNLHLDYAPAGQGGVPSAETVYTSSHWPAINNPVAHVRLNDRTDTQGRRILFLEEVQSDWQREGREKGFAGGELPEGYSVEHTPLYRVVASDGKVLGLYTTAQAAERGVLEAFERNIDADIQPTEPLWRIYGTAGEMTSASTRDAAIAKAWETLSSLRNQHRLPRAPFVTTGDWYQLPLKWALRYAAAHGYDAVSWTTGRQQQERYDLRKQVDTLRWIPDRGTSGWLTGFYGGERTIPTQYLSGDEFQHMLGRTLSERLRAQPEQTFPNGDVGQDLRGADLQYGGEWAVNLYDRTIPQFLNKYAKQWGARVETIEIPLPGDVGDSIEPHNEAVHSLPVTDAMRDTVLTHGQPLFEKGQPYALRPDSDAAASYAQAAQVLDNLSSTLAQPVSTARGGMVAGQRAGQPGAAGARVVYRRLPSNAYLDNLRQSGRAAFVGRAAPTVHDIAVLAQAVRDPRIERFFWILTQGDTVIAVDAISSRLPSSSQAFVTPHGAGTESQSALLYRVRRRMHRLGADGYYLLHNHPSGRTMPSRADIAMTRKIATVDDTKRTVRGIPGFRGHVIINHDEYSVITDPTEAPQTIPVPTTQADPLLPPSRGAIRSAEDVRKLGTQLAAGEHIVTILRDSAGRVRSVQLVPPNLFTSPEFPHWLRGQLRANGARDVFSYVDVPTPHIQEAARQWLRRGLFLDYLTAGGASLPRHEYGADVVQTPAPGYRVAEEPPGEIPPDDEPFPEQDPAPPPLMPSLSRLLGGEGGFIGAGLIADAAQGAFEWVHRQTSPQLRNTRLERDDPAFYTIATQALARLEAAKVAALQAYQGVTRLLPAQDDRDFFADILLDDQRAGIANDPARAAGVAAGALPNLTTLERARAWFNPAHPDVFDGRFQQALDYYRTHVQTEIEYLAQDARITGRRLTPLGLYLKLDALDPATDTLPRRYHEVGGVVHVGHKAPRPGSGPGGRSSTGKIPRSLSRQRARAALRASGAGQMYNGDLESLLDGMYRDRFNAAFRNRLAMAVRAQNIPPHPATGRVPRTVPFGPTGREVPVVESSVFVRSPGQTQDWRSWVPKPYDDTWDLLTSYETGHLDSPEVREFAFLGNAITSVALLSPAEAVQHALNVLGVLYNTPGTGRSLGVAGQLLGLTPLRLLAVMADLMTLNGPRLERALRTLADHGGLRTSHFGTAGEHAPWLRAVLGERGARAVSYLKRTVFDYPGSGLGVLGLEARSRAVLLLALQEYMRPGIADAEAVAVVNDWMGTYVPALQPYLVRYLRAGGLFDPFAAAGVAIGKTAIRAGLGFGPGGWNPETAWSNWIVPVLTILLLNWLFDPEKRWATQIPGLRPGDVRIYRDDNKVIDLPARMFFPSQTRALTLTGARALMQDYTRGKRGSELMLDTWLRQLFNVLAGRAGPPIRTATGLLGTMPYLGPRGRRMIETTLPYPSGWERVMSGLRGGASPAGAEVVDIGEEIVGAIFGTHPLTLGSRFGSTLASAIWHGVELLGSRPAIRGPERDLVTQGLRGDKAEVRQAVFDVAREALKLQGKRREAFITEMMQRFPTNVRGRIRWDIDNAIRAMQTSRGRAQRELPRTGTR